MSDIFLSYASEDRERVRPLVERLEEHGWSVWWDRRIPPGKTWPQVVEEALESCRAMVAVWTAVSVESDWVAIETSEGKKRHILVPVALDDVDPPLEFRRIQAADLTGWDGSLSHSELQGTFSALETILGAPTRPVEPGHGKDQAAPTVELEIDLEDLNGEGWVALDGGTFTMGSEHGEDNEKPPHQVTLSPFRISRYPVTNDQHRHFVMETGKESPGHWTGAQVPAGRESHPIVNVSWGEAEAYCKWLTKRVGEGVVCLPTEAQWEFAARGAEGREYPWGAEEPDEDRANFGGRVDGTTSVDAYPGGATPTGIYDLSGNVWEWCRDGCGPYSGNPITDPVAPSGGRFFSLRGGSFLYDARDLRAAYRGVGLPPDYRDLSLGFRVVWSAAGGQR